MPAEAATCRKLVVPKLKVAGWDNEPHSIRSFAEHIAKNIITPSARYSGHVRPTARSGHLTYEPSGGTIWATS
jgi:hypothetical protein